MIHTLLLALSASGRSADVHEQWALTIARQSIATSVQSNADKQIDKNSTPAHAEQHMGGIQRILLVSALHCTTRIVVLPPLHSHAWWDTPARNVVRQFSNSKHFAKIRKTFTVQKSHTPHAAYLLAASAPPDDYNRLLALT